MRHYSAAAYKKDGIGFPSDNVEHRLKTEDWYKQYLCAIVSQYYSDLGAISFSEKEKMVQDRRYGSGTQDPEIYKKRFKETVEDLKGGPHAVSPGPDSAEDREGYMNVNWNILPVASKFKYVLMGFFGKYSHDISIDALDPTAETERESMKHLAIVKGMFKALEQEIEKFQGIDGLNIEEEWLPRNLQEANLFQQLGGFKLGAEVVMETCIKQSYEVDSKWNKMIKLFLINDLIDHGKAATKAYICPVSGRVGHRYVDVLNYIQPWTRAKTEKAKYAGEFTTVTTEDLRNSGNFSEEEICDLINQVSKIRGLDKYWSVEEARKEDGSWAYDAFTFEVFDGEWIAPYIEFNTRRKRSDGSLSVYPADRNKDDSPKIYDTEKRKTWAVNTNVVYKGKLILGTDRVYDWGLAENIIKDGPEAQLNYSFFYVDGESITRRCKSIYDQVQIDWLVYQNARAKAAPDGIAVEVGSTENVTIGKKKLTSLDVLRIRRKTGDFLYRANPLFSQGNYSQAKPITPITGGAGKATEDFIVSMNSSMEMLREFSGITQPVSASDMNPRTGLGISRMQLQSTDNALFPILNGYEALLESSGEKTYRLIQNVFRAYSDPQENPYYGVVNKTGIRVFNNINSFCRKVFGFRISARPTDEEVQNVLTMAMNSVNSAKEGGEGITPHDFFIIQRLAFTGNIKRAEVEIGLRENQRREQRQKEMSALEAQRAEQVIAQQQKAHEDKMAQMRELGEIEAENHRKKMMAEVDAEEEKARKLNALALEKYKSFREAGFEDALVKEKV